uniref:Uncharacterized protein n=1 Tax=Rhizophora mucronata TaxID=61149 RepID=A0A2P2P2K5_RHIMU
MPSGLQKIYVVYSIVLLRMLPGSKWCLQSAGHFYCLFVELLVPVSLLFAHNWGCFQHPA